MSIIRAQLVGDVLSGSTFAGIVTATGFNGNLTGNVTGNVTGNLSGLAVTSVFAREASTALYSANAGIASTSLASSTAHGLSGKPSIDVDVVTANSYTGNGVGISSLNASNLSTGTVPSPALASDGTANSSTFLRGDRVWSTVPTGGFSNMQVFTSPGSFFVPPTTSKLKVTVTGGGGGAQFGVGGSSGATGIAVFNVTSASTIPITVGAGGQSNAISVNGGSSAFGGFVVAGGGSNSIGGVASFPAPAPSYQATIGLNGGNGATGQLPLSSTSPGNFPGGASYWGSAGIGGFTPSPGVLPTIGSYGAGGGIGPGIRTYDAIQGVVVVEW